VEQLVQMLTEIIALYIHSAIKILCQLDK